MENWNSRSARESRSIDHPYEIERGWKFVIINIENTISKKILEVKELKVASYLQCRYRYNYFYFSNELVTTLHYLLYIFLTVIVIFKVMAVNIIITFIVTLYNS